jgi:myo-inositol 2-dehydrogenase/D-chiro-inositol 1-dehydrogenase
MGLRHAQNALASPRIELVGVSDADAARARDVGERLGAAAYDDAARMLDAERLEGLVIASPAATHVPLIELAAERGVHVLCEKPLSDDGPAAARAVEAAERAGITLQIGFQMRFDADLSELAERVAAGELGRLWQLRASLRDATPHAREYLVASGGYFWDGAIHLFDLARWLAGDVAEVSAFGAALSDPMFEELGDMDNAMVVLRFASGALGVVELSRVAAYGFESGVEVLGEHGALRAPGGFASGVERFAPGEVRRSHVTDFLERFEPAYPRELEGFVDALVDGGAPRVDGRDGLAAMRLAQAAVRSQQEGRTVRVDAAATGW